MLSANHPDQLTTAFAEFGGKNPIPTTPVSGQPANYAAYSTGFPPITRIPKSASGIPPEGLDINGVLYDLSNAVRWMQAGAKYPFNATFAAAIGGYPAGAEVIGNDNVTIYRSLIDSNLGDPNMSQAGWITISNDAGMIAAFAMTNPPNGWLYCDGTTVSRVTYANLFGKIGVTYGAGNGSTTFNLPESRGEFIRGWDDGRGIDIGRAFGSYQLDAFQGHWHRQWYLTTGTTGGTGYLMEINQTSTPSDAGGVSVPVSDGINGSPRVSVETRPRNLALKYAIKY